MGKIQNFKDLAKSPLREAGLNILEAGLQAIDTQAVIRANVSVGDGAINVAGNLFPEGDVGRIFVFGVGKCAAAAAAELENILGDKLSGGFIIGIGDIPQLSKIKAVRGSHPLPSAENVAAAEELLKSTSELKENDLVIFLATGGGSTLLCAPMDGNWQREVDLFRALTKAGAPIWDLNTVRKHLSRVRGGFLAKQMYPAQVVSLVFSDVPGNEDIGFIASGPTVKDSTSVLDAKGMLEKYGVKDQVQVPEEIFLETPKEDKYFEKVKHVVVVSNQLALQEMSKKATELGFSPQVVTTKLSGEASEVGKKILQELHDAPGKTARLYGGETTVSVHGEGKGGRNMEVALGGLSEVGENELLIASSSDGRDNTEFGGALCDTINIATGTQLNLQADAFLSRNASYDYFDATGDKLLMGDTGSNVADFIIALKN